MLNFNRLRPPVGLVLALMMALAPAMVARTRKGEKLMKEGRAAEAQKLYTQALEAYEAALREDPTDTAYLLATRRVRFQAAQMHVDLGQHLRTAGQLEDALGEFQKAYAIDPASVIAEQEVRRTNEMIEKQKGKPKEEAALTPSQQARKESEARVAAVMPLPELRPISRQISSLKMNNQPVRVLYDTVGKLAGINVVFDSEFQPPPGRNFSVDLTQTTLDQALDYLGVLTKTFWKPLSQNTIFVTNDNVTKRRDYEDLVVKVFYLQNVTSVQELTEVATNIRAITDLRRIFNYNAQNALIVRGTADQVALAEKLIQDLDKPKSEVVVDVIVMETSRGRTRELAAALTSGTSTGLKIPFTFSPRNPVTVPSGGGDGTPSTTTTTAAESTSSLISLARIGKLSTNDFSVTLPSGILSALMTDRSTNVLQSPQVRAADRMKASLRIGDRVPTATGSFQPGIGAVGVSPLVNTQFQFIEVGVNVDITPNVHGPEEVTLHVELEISNVRDRIDIGGIQQPVIGQRKVIHDIRIKEGEISLLGGLMQDQDTRNMSGIPGIANVPILRHLFSTDSRDKSQSELLIALVPHIVRTPDISAVNMRGIAAGNETTVKLSFAPRKEDTPPAVATPAPGATTPSANAPSATAPGATVPGATVPGVTAPVPPAVTAPQTQPPAEAPKPAPQTPVAAAGTPVVTFTPNSAQAQVGGALAVAIQVNNANDLFAAPMRVKYDPAVLRLNEVRPGGLFSGDGQQPNFSRDIRNDVGEASWNLNRLPGSSGISGSGTVAVLTFQVIGKGATTVTMPELNLRNSQLQPITTTAPTLSVTVR